MEKEIFGPILTVYVFPDEQIEDTLHMAEKSTYGLTGSIFANDRCAVCVIYRVCRVVSHR
jgi:1-pyrroline-5-carboxylate dehydrogenase